MIRKWDIDVDLDKVKEAGQVPTTQANISKLGVGDEVEFYDDRTNQGMRGVIIATAEDNVIVNKLKWYQAVVQGDDLQIRTLVLHDIVMWMNIQKRIGTVHNQKDIAEFMTMCSI